MTFLQEEFMCYNYNVLLVKGHQSGVESLDIAVGAITLHSILFILRTLHFQTRAEFQHTDRPVSHLLWSHLLMHMFHSLLHTMQPSHTFTSHTHTHTHTHTVRTVGQL